MSQNRIKIKRSETTNLPTGLTAGELAYSYGLKKLYVGSPTGQAIEIGGEDFVAGPTSISFFTPNSGGATTTAFLGETIDLVGVNGVTVTGDSTDKVFFGLNVTGATKNNGDPIITTTTDQDGRVVIAIPSQAINSEFLDPNTFIRQFSTPKRGEREGRLGFATVEKQTDEIYTGTTSSNFLAGGGETTFIDVNPHYFGLRVGNGATSFVGVDVDGGSRLDTLSLTGTNGISISSSAALTANTVNDLLTLTISSLPRQYNASGTSLTANINENLNFTGSSNITVAGSNKTITFSTVAAPTFAGLSVTGNANVTGTLTVTGQSTLGNVNASGLTATTIRGNTSVSTPQLIATGGNFSGALTAGSGSFGSLNVTQDMSVSGNLTVLGSVVTLDVENVKIEDPIIALAKGNTVSDTIQTGFVVRYEPTVPQFPDTFAGLIRDPSSKRFVFFQDSSGSLTSSSYTLTNKASIEVAGISASGTIQSPTLSTGTILGAVIDGGTF